MTNETLKMVNDFFEGLSIPYEFMEWTNDVPSTYWVGDYSEMESLNEDGCEESNFILTGTTNGKFIELESAKTQIKNEIGNGLKAILENGSGVALLYVNAFPIPSVEFGVQRMQINLRIKEWKV